GAARRRGGGGAGTGPHEAPGRGDLRPRRQRQRAPRPGRRAGERPDSRRRREVARNGGGGDARAGECGGTRRAGRPPVGDRRAASQAGELKPMRKTIVVLLLLLLGVPAAAAVKIEEVRTPGGLLAWLVREPAIPLLAVEFNFRGGGAALDPEGRQGLANFVSGLLDEGAGELDSQAFQTKL